MPWVRVLLSCAIGDRLYPDPQWERLAATWRAMYPIAGLRPQLSATISELRATMPDLVSVIVEHRPPRLRGRSLGEVLRNPELQPGGAAASASRPGRRTRAEMALAPPTVAFAVLGQAQGERPAVAGAREPAAAAADRVLGRPELARDRPGRRTRCSLANPMDDPVRRPTRPIWTHALDRRNDDVSTNASSKAPRSTTQPAHEIAGGGIVLLTVELAAVRGHATTVEWEVVGPMPLSAQDTRIALLGATTVTGRAGGPLGGGRPTDRSRRPWTPAR